MSREAADYADPLRSWCAVHLLLEHPHGIGKGANAVPAQFHVVVEAAADDVHVTVDQPGYDPTALQIHAPCFGAGEGHDLPLVSDGDEAPIPDGQCGSFGRLTIEGRDPAVEQDQVGGCIHRLSLQASGKSKASPECAKSS